MLKLTTDEHQQLVLMTGSKRAWALYLGLDPVPAAQLWKEKNLLTPTEYTRSLMIIDLMELVVEEGSIRRAAIHLGVSESFLKKNLSQRGDQTLGPAYVISSVKKYKSIKLAVRFINLEMTDYRKLSEAEARRLIREGGEDPAALVDYAFSNHETGKGRRAELDWSGARLESQILKDMNEEEGSQADYDFLDNVFGRVNVKSSSAHRLKAKSRGQERYWKFSAHGKTKADHLICVCYNEAGEFLAWTWKKPEEVGENSFQMTESELKNDERTEWQQPID